jgi:NAD(P)-dependent dehydrogenase (short-subunit alcohol dehydrogenase family)
VIGKVVVITGANSGIGKEVAVALAAMGATTVLACRNLEKAARAATEIKQRAATDDRAVAIVPLDLADLASVRAAAQTILDTWGRVDVLVNNAGGIWTRRQTTVQGFEQTFGVNHLGHFYLTSLLVEALMAAAPARIVNVASVAHRLAVRGLPWKDLQHRRHYSALAVYGETKLANILFTRGLARRLDPALVIANAVHPGPVRSGFGMDGDARGLLGLGNRLVRPFEVSPQAGADTLIFLAFDPSVAGHTGEYWMNRHPASVSRAGRDDEAVKRLWCESERLLAGVGFPAAPHT